MACPFHLTLLIGDLDLCLSGDPRLNVFKGVYRVVGNIILFFDSRHEAVEMGSGRRALVCKGYVDERATDTIFPQLEFTLRRRRRAVQSSSQISKRRS